MHSKRAAGSDDVNCEDRVGLAVTAGGPAVIVSVGATASTTNVRVGVSPIGSADRRTNAEGVLRAVRERLA